MIGIIGAIQQEVDAITAKMTNVIKRTLFHHHFYEGKIHNQKVVVCLSGVGKVAASMATTILLTNYNITKILNIGTAGGLDPQQETLDIVISKQVIQYDFDTSTIDGISGLGLYYNSDETLIQDVMVAFQKSNLQANLYVGDILSGDSFISAEQQLIQLKQKFPTGIACEMESGAISQVCAKFQIPFVVIRSLSDIVYHDNSTIEFSKNVEITSKRSADMVEVLLHG